MRRPTHAIAVTATLLLMLLTQGCARNGGAADVEVSATASAAAREGCTRVQSAVANAEHLMVPFGQEPKQKYEGALRGRISYVVGTLQRYAEQIPPDARDEAADVIAAGEKAAAVKAATAPDRADILARYREATHTFAAACGG